MEATNFFSNVASLDLTGDLQLTIKKTVNDNWVVSVILNNEQCGDKASRLIPPLNLRGSASELDNGFFEQVTAPVQAASGLMVNMEAFMKQMEEARKHSAMEKERADREKKEKEAKEKKYKEALQKVDELEQAGKYRDAWVKVPEPSEYPEQAETLRKRKSSLAAKFAPDLFGADAATIGTPLEIIQETNTPDDDELQEDEFTDEQDDDNDDTED